MPTAKTHSKGRSVWAVGFFVLLIIIGAGILLREVWLSRQKPPVEEVLPPMEESAPTPSPLEEAPSPPSQLEIPESVPEPSVPLPPLDQSDALARSLAKPFSGDPDFPAFLVPDDLIRRFVLVVDNIARGDVPKSELQSLRPRQEFRAALNAQDEWIIDPASFQRYDRVANLVASLDTRAIVKAYTLLRPLFQQAYLELGMPNGSFDATLEQALRNLLDTPTTGQEIALTPRTNRFEFADPDLEARSPVQRQLLRMGPDNARKIKSKLGELVTQLDFDPSH